VMCQAGDGVHGARMRAFIVLLWLAGLRINEALTEHDLEPRAGRCSSATARAAAGARSAWTRGAGSTSVPGSVTKGAIHLGPTVSEGGEQL
jgi:hypothetical protein